MTAPYRGPSSFLPFPRHRSMARVIADEALSGCRYGDPEERRARTLDLKARKDALGISFAKLGLIAGIDGANVQQYLTVKRLGSLFTLDLIDEALKRGEAAFLRARQEAASTPARRLINDHASNQFQNAEEVNPSALRSHVGAVTRGILPPLVSLMGGADDSLPPILFTTDSVGRIASRPGCRPTDRAAFSVSPASPLPSLARGTR